jgi:FlaA1/EpsC-like NDP-sugar epimerase
MWRSIRLFYHKNLWVMLFIDIVLLSLCYFSAYWLRFDGQLTPQYLQLILLSLPPLLICKIGSFIYADLYRGLWRYTGVLDLINVIKGSVLGSLLFLIYLALVLHFKKIPRSVLVVDLVFTIVSIGGVRLLIRIYYQQSLSFADEMMFWRKFKNESKRVLIIGTGPLAERLFRELYGQQAEAYRVVGFIDEETMNRGRKIHGVPVLGSAEDIPELLNQHKVDDIFIVGPEFKANGIKDLVELCAGHNVRVKVIPSLTEMLSGAVAQHLRDIEIEDLLERDAVKIDMQGVTSDIRGKDVLVTGAGGSIGSELCRQILKFGPRRLILLDNAETPLYSIEMELRGICEGVEVIPCIGDVRNTKNLEHVFAAFQPQLVFHAAAYKHVPMMELVPLEAVHTNILGTARLAAMACRFHVQKFVMISTDKAVRPTSIMGVSKRVAEMVVQSMNSKGPRFVIVRFGNVLGSNGSVVPLFEKQIASGGPVTVTHPEVTRYFMTIPEAVMLVLQAGAMGKGGELFLLDMGEPVKIVDLAKNMIRLAGLVPDRDVRIEFIGLRPGEKLYEELLIAGEGVVDTAFDKIKICKHSNGGDDRRLSQALEQFERLIAGSYDHEAALNILRSLVPAYNESAIKQGKPPLPASGITPSEDLASSQGM